MFNDSTVIGRLTADPELRVTPNGKKVCNFRIAAERPYKVNGERQTDFIPCFCWGKEAENLAAYFKKGEFIGVNGSLQSRDYSDREGKKHFVLELCIDRWFFVGSKPKAESSDTEADKEVM